MENIIEGLNDTHLEPVKVLRLFETNKHGRSEFVIELVEKLESGEIDPLKTHLQVKAMEDIIQMITTTDEKKNQNAGWARKYKDIILDAAQKYGSKPFELGNAKFEVKESGTKYDFSNCGDEEWETMDAQLKSLQERIKEREKFLKSLPESGVQVVGRMSKEEYTIYPPTKTSTTTVFTTLR